MEVGYEGRIGRYSTSLAVAFLEFVDVAPCSIPLGSRALDVGCGPGALTAQLAARLGPEHVTAVDTAPEDVTTCRGRLPGVDVREAAAEALPFPAGAFDVVVAQLLVALLADPAAGVGEMRRVARTGGTVAACSWDFADGMRVVRAFWDAAVARDPSARAWDPADKPASTPPALRALFESAGLRSVGIGELTARADYTDFDDLWEPLVAPDGPPGAYWAELTAADRSAVRDDVWRRLDRPAGAFPLTARAWCVRGTA
ncbi:MAG: class I SAM-dependent methyltransferase [Pseudonocardiaceae bacterium]